MTTHAYEVKRKTDGHVTHYEFYYKPSAEDIQAAREHVAARQGLTVAQYEIKRAIAALPRALDF